MYQIELPKKIILGTGALNLLGQEISGYGKKVLLVAGRGALKKQGILPRVEEILKSIGKEVVIFEGVPPEPETAVVDEGVNICRKEKIELVLGLGGGSVLDVAKAVAGLAKEKKYTTVADYLEIDGPRRLSGPGVPLVAIPTTAGTGSEATKNSVILNRRTRAKRSLRSSYLLPQLALLDPEITLSLNKEVTVTSGLDALTHLVEGYVCKKANPFCDALALTGIGMIGTSLPELLDNLEDLSLRTKMLEASLYGGMVLANSGLGLAHGISPFLGPAYRISHGLTTALLLPAVLGYNSVVSKEKCLRLVSAFTGQKPVGVGTAVGLFGQRIKEIMKKAGLPLSLKKISAGKDKFDFIARQSLTANSTKVNPRQTTEPDILSLLNQVYA